ncbi:MAG: hypothetical protein HC896_05830 [Bacteroidales bacterium]|nr:hypothetical protein [Bacteroidales bacterium]
MKESSLYVIALSFLTNIGPVAARKLIAAVGSAEDVFIKPLKEIAEIKNVNPSLVKVLEDRLNALKKAEEEIKFAEKHKISVISFLDKEYRNV